LAGRHRSRHEEDITSKGGEDPDRAGGPEAGQLRAAGLRWVDNQKNPVFETRMLCKDAVFTCVRAVLFALKGACFEV
jgi:hypothetical protein